MNRFRFNKCFQSVYFLILILLIICISCDEAEYYESVEVSIISTFMTCESNSTSSWANVRYTVENIGTKELKGWEVFFNVHLERGPQLIAHESTYYTLEPGEISSGRVVKVLIPDYYDKAKSATLRHIETW